jgi:hypothetical protein
MVAVLHYGLLAGRNVCSLAIGARSEREHRPVPNMQYVNRFLFRK